MLVLNQNAPSINVVSTSAEEGSIREDVHVIMSNGVMGPQGVAFKGTIQGRGT
ncbi:hypothetical protein GCM10007927_12780 [Sulfitobacter pacificus]|uniref:Uncharacterized protein n=1 Tax=Sulfitobacter pacificus TaxID=1499314 RepID=A0ABQ5VHB7_9RHOB|nr:hypothetical protein GCM10007927_12780 [Sulfitobacter pacificus]